MSKVTYASRWVVSYLVLQVKVSLGVNQFFHRFSKGKWAKLWEIEGMLCFVVLVLNLQGWSKTVHLLTFSFCIAGEPPLHHAPPRRAPPSTTIKMGEERKWKEKDNTWNWHKGSLKKSRSSKLRVVARIGVKFKGWKIRKTLKSQEGSWFRAIAGDAQYSCLPTR